MAAILQTFKETSMLFFAFPTFDFYLFSFKLIRHDTKQIAFCF
jgi:hypothetical protein